jgi:hypothetical protein
MINTLPFNVTIIAGNCNSDFVTTLYNNIEEIIIPLFYIITIVNQFVNQMCTRCVFYYLIDEHSI